MPSYIIRFRVRIYRFLRSFVYFDGGGDYDDDDDSAHGGNNTCIRRIHVELIKFNV